MKKNNILSCFPSHITPREVQKNALLALEKNWDNADVLVVNLPVASGKSACAMALAKWGKKASIITPSKLLVNQYKEEYPRVHVLRAKSDYWCETFDCPLHKRPRAKKIDKLCKPALGCNGCNVYRSDLRKARVMPYLLSNYYIYLAHRLYRDILIIDEAHSLIDVLKNLAAKKLWQFQYKFPSHIRTRKEIRDWVNNLPSDRFFYKHRQGTQEKNFGEQDTLQFLKDELNSFRPSYLISIAEDEYRGEQETCIKMTPLDIADAPPVVWPSSVKKIILLSATISRKDIEQLGLSRKRIQYIQADSPITAERRPVCLSPNKKSMAIRHQDSNFSGLVDEILLLATHHKEEKGLVHATYSLADKLKTVDWPESIRDRLIFHNKTNKGKKYEEFREADGPAILVASGMYEGIDLPYDAGRWQLLAKIPWPSLGDPAIKYLSEQDPEWYIWQTLKTTMQAFGRICRTPEDYGITYIYDETFERLYNSAKQSKLVPKWLDSSIKVS